MSNVYLTVDLDFWNWNRCSAPPKHPEQQARRFIRRLLAHGCPVSVYVEHGEILPELASDNYDKVINIDFHDDLVLPDDVDDSPIDASWVNRVLNRGEMLYEWRYPDYRTCCFERWGLCAGPGTRLWPDRDHDWRRIERQQGVVDLPWSSIGRASVVLSPDFSRVDSVLPALELLLAQRRVVRTKDVMRTFKSWQLLLPW